MTTSRLLARLEDFRLLPVFVLVSMAIGIAIGKALLDLGLRAHPADRRPQVDRRRHVRALASRAPSAWACPSASS